MVLFEEKVKASHPPGSAVDASDRLEMLEEPRGESEGAIEADS